MSVALGADFLGPPLLGGVHLVWSDASSLGHDAQTPPYGVGVEIERPTDAFEGVRPVRLVGQEPMLRLSEKPSAFKVRGETVLLQAIERVLQNGDHEPLFGRLHAPPGEMLRGQHDVAAHHSNG